VVSSKQVNDQKSDFIQHLLKVKERPEKRNTPSLNLAQGVLTSKFPHQEWLQSEGLALPIFPISKLQDSQHLGSQFCQHC
jgi:hypothetical protein